MEVHRDEVTCARSISHKHGLENERRGVMLSANLGKGEGAPGKFTCRVPLE